VRALSSIVLDEAGVEIARYAAVMQLIIRLADNYVNIMEAFHRTNRGACEAIITEDGWPAKP
jgi:hypothetical protein